MKKDTRRDTRTIWDALSDEKRDAIKKLRRTLKQQEKR